MSDEKADRICELAAENNLADADMIAMYGRVNSALKKEFQYCDSGMGGGWADFWVRVDDVEYKLVMRPHRSLKATS